MLDASDIEGEGGEVANTEVEVQKEVADDKEIMAPSPEQQADPVGDNDTPELEDLVKEAKQSNLDDPGSVPPSVFKILEQAKGRQLGGRIHFMQPLWNLNQAPKIYRNVCNKHLVMYVTGKLSF